MTPYDVACTVFSLDRLSRIDGGEWSELGMLARSWFDQVDRSGRPVYDREAGRVADGVDEGRVSENSGAEANLVAAEALFEEALGSVPAAVTLLPRPANG